MKSHYELNIHSEATLTRRLDLLRKFIKEIQEDVELTKAAIDSQKLMDDKRQTNILNQIDEHESATGEK